MSQPVCPYCRGKVDVEKEPATVCPVCGTPHHRDCWEENQGCTVFGCSAAPVEEAMIQVRPEELLPPAASGWTSTADSAPGPAPDDSTGVAPPPPTRTGLPATWHTGTFLQSPDDPSSTAFAHPEVQSLSSIERSTYVWLAVLAGVLGVHNLYANRTTAGIIQLCTSLLSCLLLSPFVWIWALVEAATVDQDGDGLPWR